MTNNQQAITTPPKHLCLVRLSSIGDVIHILPIINTIRSQWADTQLTWIINRREYQLVQHMPNINFIVFDKAQGLSAYWTLKKQLAGRVFDVLLLMQNSLRANLLSGLVRAPIRIGFDRRRAKELHSLFINRRIAARKHQHVLDGFFCFSEYLGLPEQKLVWDHCYRPEDEAYIKQLCPEDKKLLVINPCSSNEQRNWLIERYAQIADYAIEQYGLAVVLSGADSESDRHYGQAIEQTSRHRLYNLIGQTSLPQLMALMAQATAVIAPDSGPLHIANAVNTPCIGLFAASNPLRTGAYLYADYCVNAYPQAVRQFLHRDSETVPWGMRVHHHDAMRLIKVEQVKAMLAKVLRLCSNKPIQS